MQLLEIIYVSSQSSVTKNDKKISRLVNIFYITYNAIFYVLFYIS